MVGNKRIFVILLAFIPLFVHSQQPTALDYFNDAEAARMSGSLYLAIEQYKEAIALNPQYVDAREGLAESYFAIAEYVEALSHVRAARTIDRRSVSLATLEGRVLLGNGNIEEAESVFLAVRAVEPNNIEALFGLAELDVAQGRPTSAAARFISGLRAQPGNIRALLSLVTIYDGTGNIQAAERYVREALLVGSGDPLVRYIAAKHYFALGDLDQASHHVSLAIEILPSFAEAIRLAGAISLRSNMYAEAVTQLETLLRSDREDYLLWFSLGIAYRRVGRIDESLNALARAVNIRSDDELSRLALESLLISRYPIETEVRQRYALYRFAVAEAFLEENLSEAALEHFRKGLLLDPRSRDGRFGYAHIYKTRGNYAKYVSELSVLAELGELDREIQDEIEIYSSIIGESVHADWRMDQFILDRTAHNIQLFSMTQPGNLLHPEGDQTLLDALETVLRRYENVAIVKRDGEDRFKVGTFSEAFELARGAETDYFVILSFHENEREIALLADIYHAETGTKLRSFAMQNTGNGRIELTLRKFSRVLHSLLPFRAQLLDRRFSIGLVDAGTLNGVEEGQELLIVKNGALENDRRAIAFTYPEDAILGTLTVTRVDDLLSEGTIEPNGFFDRINLNDTLIMPLDTEETDGADDSTDTVIEDEPEARGAELDPLYRELLRIP